MYFFLRSNSCGLNLQIFKEITGCFGQFLFRSSLRGAGRRIDEDVGVFLGCMCDGR